MLNPKFDTCFFERYAMVSLATLGIEVTRAIRENKNVANALVNEMAGEDVKEVNAEDLRHINQSGYAYGLGDGTLIGRNEYEFWSLALPLKRILEIKMDKVNNGFYGDFNEFGLFVFTKEDLDLDQIKQTIAFMMEKQAYQNRLYSRLFISQIQTLFDCDLETGRYRKIKISQEQRRSFYEEAIQ